MASNRIKQGSEGCDMQRVRLQDQQLSDCGKENVNSICLENKVGTAVRSSKSEDTVAAENQQAPQLGTETKETQRNNNYVFSCRTNFPKCKGRCSPSIPVSQLINNQLPKPNRVTSSIMSPSSVRLAEWYRQNFSKPTVVFVDSGLSFQREDIVVPLRQPASLLTAQLRQTAELALQLALKENKLKTEAKTSEFAVEVDLEETDTVASETTAFWIEAGPAAASDEEKGEGTKSREGIRGAITRSGGQGDSAAAVPSQIKNGDARSSSSSMVAKTSITANKKASFFKHSFKKLMGILLSFI